MASAKETHAPSRPMGLNVPNPRQSNGRQHSHSVSLGAVNLNHRVTRRKSMTANAPSNTAAMAAAAVLNENGGAAANSNNNNHNRKSVGSRRGTVTESTSMGPSSSFSSFMARSAVGRHSPNSIANNMSSSNSNNTAVDGSAASSTAKPVSMKNRSRRASEGSHLIKGEGKRSLTELKCDRCGKGYKHSSCLTKHMWEHDPAWAYTSKLLISKHQQVQLLEAATVLVNMNPEHEGEAEAEAEPEPEPAASEAPRIGSSDRSSTSPTASGISELRNGLSSTETTPPPAGDEMAFSAKSRDVQHQFTHNSHNNNSSSAFSRSFQSVPSSSFTGSIPSHSPVHGHFRQSSVDTRPSTSDNAGGVLDDDAEGLAAAVELCNFGTPRSIPTPSADVPPVPPLPAQYLGQGHVHVNGTSVPAGAANNNGNSNNNNNNLRASLSAAPHSFDVRTSSSSTGANSSTPTTAMYNSLSMHAPLSYRVSDERDVKMDDVKEDDGPHRSAADDDDDDGVFGRMEE